MAVASCLMAAAALSSNDKNLSLSAGLEYQTISQDYYDAIIETTVDTTSQDLIEVKEILNRTTDQVDDAFLRTNLTYDFRTPHKKVNLISDFEISRDRFLGRIEGYYTRGNFSKYLRLYGRFENKSPFEENKNTETGYNNLLAEIKSRLKLSSSLGLILKGSFENINYTNLPRTVDTTDDGNVIAFSSYNYDYSTFTGRVGGELALTEIYDNLYWYFQYRHRQVPDSAAADYDNYRINAEYSGFGDYGNLSIMTETELKDYRQSGDSDDYLALYFRTRLIYFLGHNWEGHLNYKLDRCIYRQEDLINHNNWLISPELKVLKQLNSWQIGPLARFEMRRESVIDEFSEDYNEFAVGWALSFFSVSSFFLDSEISRGHRAYRGTDSIISDYYFWSGSILAGFEPNSRISFNLMFDSDFEDHDKQDDDTDLYFFSIGLTVHL